MNLLTRTGSVQECSETSRFERWSGDPGYSPKSEVVTDAVADGLELRLALLAKAIESEIIPRLMLAHRAGATETLTPQPASINEVGQKDVENFTSMVLSADDSLAQTCIEAMRARGISVESIYLDLLAPVARYLGELWDQDLCDFTEVTVGLGRLHRVLRELSPAFSQSNDQPANCRRILLLPAPREQHTFGLVMVAEFFRRSGWDVAGGPWEAGADASVMVKREWFDVVGFSLASEVNLSDLGDCIQAVRATALNRHVGIIVGGPTFAVHPEYVGQIGADAFAADGNTAPALAEKIVASRTSNSA